MITDTIISLQKKKERGSLGATLEFVGLGGVTVAGIRDQVFGPCLKSCNETY